MLPAIEVNAEVVAPTTFSEDAPFWTSRRRGKKMGEKKEENVLDTEPITPILNLL